MRFVNVNTNYKISKNNWILIVLLAYIVASKFCDDETIINKDFSYLYNDILSLKKLQMLEIEFLKNIQFNLYISPKDYTEIYFELLNNY